MLFRSLLGTSAFARKIDAGDEPTFRQRILATYDVNKDGRLGDDEFKAMKVAVKQQKANRRAQLLAKYDLDKSGKLDQTERAALKADRQAALLAKFDANHNGAIDKSERKAIEAEHIQLRRNHAFTVQLLRFDDNSDSKLQFGELPGKGRAKQKRLRAMDTDHDRAIERSEFRLHKPAKATPRSVKDKVKHNGKARGQTR